MPASLFSAANVSSGVDIKIPRLEYTLLHHQATTYQGSVGTKLSGIFHFYVDRGEIIWYIIAEKEIVRLIFYCRSLGGINFCIESRQVPFQEGQLIDLKGTLIEPSQWNPKLSDRQMEFDADLYVMTPTF